jgi:hypothetical protein
LTKQVLESALEGEITDHVGYDKHERAGRNSGNSRNGTRAKTVQTDVGPVEVRVPRDVAGTFEPQIGRKRQRRLSGVDDLVLSLSAKGSTHGEFGAHLAGCRRPGVGVLGDHSVGLACGEREVPQVVGDDRSRRTRWGAGRRTRSGKRIPVRPTRPDQSSIERTRRRRTGGSASSKKRIAS